MPAPITNCPHTDRRHYGRGMCLNCYQKWRYHNDPDHRAKVLARTSTRNRTANKTYYAEGRGGRGREASRRAAELRRLKKYGLTPEKYQQMIANQNGACAICTEPLGKRFAVDHDHKTGNVRGLLCILCNIGLGQFKDSTFNLSQAILYLTRSASP